MVTESRDRSLVMAWQGEGATDVREDLEAALLDVGTVLDENGIPVELVDQLAAYRERMGMVS